MPYEKMTNKKVTPTDFNEAPANEPSVLDHMLTQSANAPLAQGLQASSVASWSGQEGVLSNGEQATLSPSCLVAPCDGDQVLIWMDAQGVCFVLAVLVRKLQDEAIVIQSKVPMDIEAPVVGLHAQSVRIQADDFLTRAKRRHAVEDTRTETITLRVAQVETDIRYAGTVFDEVSGSLMQRTGTWISNTVREVRHKARTFLFD